MSCNNNVPKWCGECWTTPTITIVQQPQPIDGEIGTPHTLSITAVTSSGYPLHYQWCKDGIPIVSATQREYLLPDEEIDALYCCKLRDGDAELYSDSVQVNIVDPVPNIIITQQPTPIDGELGNSYSLNVVATTDSGNQLTYQWYQDSVAIVGATSDTYDLPDVETDSMFYVDVIDGAYSVQSDVVSVEIVSVEFKIRMEYTDGTPTFTVPLDGSTIVTQADGDLAINNYDVDKILRMTIGDTMTSIDGYAFSGSIWEDFNSEVVLPDSVTSIGNYTFAYWYIYNKPFSIPDSVVSIGSSSFTNWESFNQPFIIPDSIGYIPPSSFAFWKSFNQHFSIPESVVNIEAFAFSDWEVYNYDFVFEHIGNIPIFDTTFGNIFSDWKSGFPVRITTPNSTSSNSEWKQAIGDNNYNAGDIESINGVLWNDIP